MKAHGMRWEMFGAGYRSEKGKYMNHKKGIRVKEKKT